MGADAPVPDRLLGLGHIHCERWRMTWPFPPFPNPKHKDQRKPKFNPENEEDAPV